MKEEVHDYSIQKEKCIVSEQKPFATDTITGWSKQ